MMHHVRLFAGALLNLRFYLLQKLYVLFYLRALGCLEIVVDTVFSVFRGVEVPAFLCEALLIRKSELRSTPLIYDMPYL
jgi:hypothetical protein